MDVEFARRHITAECKSFIALHMSQTRHWKFSGSEVNDCEGRMAAQPSVVHANLTDGKTYSTCTYTYTDTDPE